MEEKLFRQEGDEVIEFTPEEYAQYEIDKLAVDALAAAALLPPTPEEKLFNATGLTVGEYKALGL